METYMHDFENRDHYKKFVKDVCIDHTLVVKFTATWCVPCKKIYDYCLQRFNELDKNNILCIEIDIDESFDTFAFLKHKKMIQGVPTIYLYRQGKDNFIPDESVTGTNITDLDYFFNNL